MISKRITNILKKTWAAALLLLLCGCGSSGEGSVYYLNFKAEQDEVWQQLAKEYTAKTGVEVAVVSGF